LFDNDAPRLEATAGCRPFLVGHMLADLDHPMNKAASMDEKDEAVSECQTEFKPAVLDAIKNWRISGDV
jgi:hypothetical protein